MIFRNKSNCTLQGSNPIHKFSGLNLHCAHKIKFSTEKQISKRKWVFVLFALASNQHSGQADK